MPGVNPGVAVLLLKQSHAMHRMIWKRPSQFSCWIIEKLSFILCQGSMKCFNSLWTSCRDFFFNFSISFFLGTAVADDFQRALLHNMELISCWPQPQSVGFYDLPGGSEHPLLFHFNKCCCSDSRGTFGKASHDFPASLNELPSESTDNTPESGVSDKPWLLGVTFFFFHQQSVDDLNIN